MSNYNATPPNGVTALYPGDSKFLFNAESPAAPQASLQVALPPAPYGSGAQSQIQISIAYAAAPTAVINIQTANDDADANYINAGVSSTNKQVDQLAIATNAPFLRVQLTSEAAGGAVTVKAYRAA